MKIVFALLLLAIPAHSAWIHPQVKEAIKIGGPDFIMVDGVKQFTGYRPSYRHYDGAVFRSFNDFSGRTAGTPIPDELDYRKLAQSPVRGQQAGDCWAQGGVSAFEFTVNAADRVSRIFSVQDVIDCSGFGSARSGGQLSMKHFEKGGAYEAEYPYQGRDTRCKISVARHEKAIKSFYLRGADGKFPVLQEIQRAIMETGALEVCGSAGALGSGGRQDNVRNGSVNHCYGLVGWFQGKPLGWLDATYLIIKNSWGDGSGSDLSNDRDWGDNGYGYYPLAKADGVHLKGSVITELQGVEYKPLLPPGPIEFVLESAQVSIKVVMLPAAPFNEADAKKALKAALDSLDK